MRDFAAALAKDLSAAEGGEFKLVPPGVYQTVISGVEQKKFTSGSSGLILTYKITDGDEEGNDVRESIVMFDANGVANDFAAARLKKRLMAVGFEAAYITNGFKYPTDEKKLGDFGKMIGKPMQITVAHRVADKGTAKGKTFADVKKAEAPTT